MKYSLERISQKLQIKITTNGSIYPTQKILSLLNRHDVYLDVSIDSIGNLAEVMRYGAPWKLIDNNIQKFLM